MKIALFFQILVGTMLHLSSIYAQHTPKKVLIVATNHTTFKNPNEKTGAWLSEITHFYEVLRKAGYEMDIVSPLGGQIPLDPKSTKKLKGIDKTLMDDAVFLSKITKSMKPEEVQIENYIAIYYAGGHGVMWDFPDNAALMRISTQIYEQNGAVTAVCHGVAGLLNLKDSNNQFLIKGKRVTGFSNKEEKWAGKTKKVPFALQTELLQREAIYSKSGVPFSSHVVVDGRIITGQNPASAKAVGEQLVAWLKNTAH